MMRSKALGRKLWVIAGGHIPLRSNGSEPVFTSHDKVAILNVSSDEVEVTFEIFYEDRPPAKLDPLSIGGQRMRKVRFNDLIDPFPLPLDTPFACLIKASGPVVVQFSRMDTSHTHHAGFLVTPLFVR
jgi:hypothetical protein